MLSTIFFDWGGVIASDPGDDFLMKLLLDIGATEEQASALFDTLLKQFMRGSITEAEFWDVLRNDYGLKVHDTISDEFTKWRGLIVDDAVFGLVDAARQTGVKTAILSNVIEPTYNVLEKAGYYSRFDAVIASCKVGYAKPEPEIYQLALDTMQVAPDATLFIDDKSKNLLPAITLGMKTIEANNPKQIIADTLSACPELIPAYRAPFPE